MTPVPRPQRAWSGPFPAKGTQCTPDAEPRRRTRLQLPETRTEQSRPEYGLTAGTERRSFPTNAGSDKGIHVLPRHAPRSGYLGTTRASRTQLCALGTGNRQSEKAPRKRLAGSQAPLGHNKPQPFLERAPVQAEKVEPRWRLGTPPKQLCLPAAICPSKSDAVTLPAGSYTGRVRLPRPGTASSNPVPFPDGFAPTYQLHGHKNRASAGLVVVHAQCDPVGARRQPGCVEVNLCGTEHCRVA